MSTEDTELYVTRLQESFEQLKYLPQRSVHDAMFRRWRNRTQRTLDQLFGPEHDYSTSFSELEFSMEWEPEDPNDWSNDDQLRFNESVAEAGHIIRDALQEGQHRLRTVVAPYAAVVSPRRASQKQVDGGTPAPAPIQVNIYNTLSNVTVLSQSQVLTLVDHLDLDAGHKEHLKRLAADFQAEADGKRRWSVLGKSLEGMKKVGTVAYEKVALPLLLAYIKKELGLGGS